MFLVFIQPISILPTYICIGEIRLNSMYCIYSAVSHNNTKVRLCSLVDAFTEKHYGELGLIYGKCNCHIETGKFDINVGVAEAWV